MLNAQILVDPLLKLAVKMDLVRHGDFLSEDSNQVSLTRSGAFMTEDIACRHAAAIAHAKDFPMPLAG
jgi:hypothetical protein